MHERDAELLGVIRQHMARLGHPVVDLTDEEIRKAPRALSTHH